MKPVCPAREADGGQFSGPSGVIAPVVDQGAVRRRYGESIASGTGHWARLWVRSTGLQFSDWLPALISGLARKRSLTDLLKVRSVNVVKWRSEDQEPKAATPDRVHGVGW